MDLRTTVLGVLWIVLLSTCLCTSGKIIFTFNILTFTFYRSGLSTPSLVNGISSQSRLDVLICRPIVVIRLLPHHSFGVI